MAQITDTHILPPGQMYGNTSQTKVSERLKQIVEHLNALIPRPDVVLLTGDAIETGGQEAYQYLKEILQPLTIPLYIIPGNHDDREELRIAFATKPYMPQKGFVQYVIDDYPVRLIGLDTHVPNENYGLLCTNRLLWLEEKLNESSKPTLIFMHHFPMKVGLRIFDNMLCRVEGDFEGLIQSFSHILGIVAGHYHKTCVRIFGGKICFVAPSVAPSHYFLTAEDQSVTAIDLGTPSFTLHKWLGDYQMISEVYPSSDLEKRIPIT
jgi:3',5'-cyclic AMP phosphodiesterase CpdA